MPAKFLKSALLSIALITLLLASASASAAQKVTSTHHEPGWDDSWSRT